MSTEQEKPAKPEAVPTTADRSGVGMTVGVIVFLAGVALLVLVFKFAYDMFTTPPAQTLDVNTTQGIDFTKALPNLVNVAVRILLLLVMGIVGSLIANRGVSLFTGSRTHRHH